MSEAMTLVTVLATAVCIIVLVGVVLFANQEEERRKRLERWHREVQRNNPIHTKRTHKKG